MINSINVSAKIDEKLAIEKRSAESNNEYDDEYPNYALSKHRFVSRGVRLPSESILLGRRRLPDEAVLLGRRGMPDETVLLGRRGLANAGLFLSKRR